MLKLSSQLQKAHALFCNSDDDSDDWDDSDDDDVMQAPDAASSSSQRRPSVREAVPSSRTRLPGLYGCC